jgi:hypothetical protein
MSKDVIIILIYHPQKPIDSINQLGSSGDVTCFLWGTDKPNELSWVLNKNRTIDNVKNCDNYINIPSSQTYR